MTAHPSMAARSSAPQRDGGLRPLEGDDPASTGSAVSTTTRTATIRGRFTAGEARQARRLSLVIGIVGFFFVVELGGALLADSVVLQADAVHLLMDLLALSVSLIAMHLAVSSPTPQFTYGLRRAEPVAALFSAALVLVTTAAIVAEGVKAFEQQSAPKAGLMLLVAAGAILVNGLSAWLLHDATGHPHGDPDATGHPHGDPEASGHPHGDPDATGHSHGDPEACHGYEPSHASGEGHGHEGPLLPKAHGHALNLRGAWLHLAGDTLGALGALAAAIFIRFGGNPRADPIASFLVAGILLVGSVRLVRDATLVLLEAAPRHLPVRLVRRLVAEFPGVLEICDLHVWTLGAGHDAITVRVSADDLDFTLAERISRRLRRAVGAEYVTVQVERRAGATGRPVSNPTEAT